ncbi:MAG: DUF2141 domain-containing protein [Nitrospirota bacterium]
MKKVVFVFSLFVFSLLFAGERSSATPPNPMEGTVTVVVTGLKNQNGNVNVAMFSSKEGFPGDREKIFTGISVPLVKKMKDGKMVIPFSHIPFGTYAVAVMHDENANQKMDKNWVGVPKEGYCASNNAKSFLAPPQFEDANFELISDLMEVGCKINY